MRSATLAALGACVALAGCAHAVRDADVRLPAAYEVPPSANAQASTPAGAVQLDRWWLAFNDTQLTGLIDQALMRNPDARTAAARLREVQANRTSALTSFLPQGNLQGNARRTHTTQIAGTAINIPGYSTTGDSEAYSGTFNVSWEVDIFGRVFAAAKAANAEVAAQRFDYEATRAAIAANVADAYFQARGLSIQLADANESARIERSLYDLVNRRVQAGLAAGQDADRVAGDLSQAEAQAEGLKAELQAQQRTLLILAGRIVEPTANISITPNVGAAPAVPIVAPGVLLTRRPDVREAQARVASAAGQVALARLAFLPTFNFTPGLGWQRQEQPGFFAETKNYSIGGNVIQPIFDIPNLIAQLHLKNAQAEEAVIAYEKTVQTAFSESEGALVRLDADRKRVALLTDGEARAARAYNASRIGYDRGFNDLQTTLTTEQSWRSIRSQLTAAQVQALRRAVQAYKALGGGWPVETYPSSTKAG
jgi:multidrug efflux system outer membrane protein